MIYLDTSVALAELFAEDQQAPAATWNEPLVSSRLLEYELWTRIHARGLSHSHDEAVRSILARVSLVELSPVVLTRALAAFPVPVRTLDALHLGTLHFLREAGQRVRLATFDTRMRQAAAALQFDLAF